MLTNPSPFLPSDFEVITLGQALLGAALLMGTRLGHNPLSLVWGHWFVRDGLDQAPTRFGWLLVLLAGFNLLLSIAGPIFGFAAYFYAKLLIVMPISGVAAWWIGRRLRHFRIDS